MDTAFEEHTQRVAGEVIEWVSGVAWSVWNWRAEWASARGEACYAALDDENAQRDETDARRLAKLIADEHRQAEAGGAGPHPLPAEPGWGFVKCPHCTGEVIAVTPIEQDVLYRCQVCQQGNQAVHTSTCTTVGCRPVRICRECLGERGLLERMDAISTAPRHFRHKRWSAARN